jgi:nitric oxide reductase activation protein
VVWSADGEHGHGAAQRLLERVHERDAGSLRDERRGLAIARRPVAPSGHAISTAYIVPITRDKTDKHWSHRLCGVTCDGLHSPLRQEQTPRHTRRLPCPPGRDHQLRHHRQPEAAATALSGGCGGGGS